MPNDTSLPTVALGRVTSEMRQLDNGDLYFTGLGVVFSTLGEDGEFSRDMVGTIFYPPPQLYDDKGMGEIGTNYFIGDWLYKGKRVPLTWDHGRGIVGARELGYAEFREVTEEGLEFAITIERAKAKRWADLAAAMYNERSLGLSSQTLATLGRENYSTGEIVEWGIGEMALTVSPADGRTKDYLREVARTVGIDLEDFNEGGRTMPKDVTITMPADGDQLDPDARVSMAEEVDTLFDEIDGAEQEERTLRTILDMLQTAQDTLVAIESRIATLEANALTADQLDQRVDAVVTEVRDVREGVVTFTSRLRAALSRRADLVESEVEREETRLPGAMNRTAQAPKTVRAAHYSNIPTNAPGMN